MFDLLTIAFIGCVAWLGMQFVALFILGVNPRNVLDQISQGEAVFFAGYAWSTAYLVAQLFSRFVFPDLPTI